MHWNTVLLLWPLAVAVAATSDPNAWRQPPSQTPNDDRGVVELTLIDIPLGTPDPENEIPGEPLNPQDFISALSVSMIPPPMDSVLGDPIQNSGKFEGDIVGVAPNDVADHGRVIKGHLKSGKLSARIGDKNAIKDMNQRWSGGNIPYVISSSFSPADRSVIARAFLEYKNKTCIRFVPRSNERDYIHIMEGSGCFSNVGRTGGGQTVSLGKGCIHVGIVIHELMHAAGFWHEQSRADRDDHIEIIYDNVLDGMGHNFLKYTLDRIQHLGAPYDTGSVMHYDAYAFAKDPRRPTIRAKNKNAELGQRRGFSPIDVLKLNRLYQCEGSVSVEVTTPTPLVSTELPGKCEDTNKYCSIWSSMGECKRNSAWMSISCRKSCKQCGVDCDNFNVHCDSWAKAGECERNGEYMNLYCPKACGLCGSGNNAVACDDSNRFCATWASRGQCKANPDWMLVNCKKSCKKC